MSKTVGVYEAKTHLPTLLNDVAAGAEITITKHGVPVAKLVSVQNEQKKLTSAEVLAAIRSLPKSPLLPGERIKDFIEEGRRI